MRQTVSWLSVIGLLLLAGVARAAPVKEYTLGNGLRLIVQQDHRAPVVVSQVWYRVGAGYEQPGTTGISHALEHMMFQGTKRYGPNQFSRIISENGGQDNAFTSADYTVYFQQLEKDRLPIAFELEADRMHNLTLLPRRFAKEIKVVMEERRLRTDDDPTALTYEVGAATAYQTSPYRHPVIGWMSDLRHMKVADLRAWYRRWYVPNNATVVVVGDVDPERVHALARKYFGVLPRKPVPQEKPRPEVVQHGLKRVVVKAPAKLPYLLMGYKVPSLKTALASGKEASRWEPYALEVLAGVLDGDGSSRLTRNLVRGEQVAASAGAGYDLTARLSTLFVFDATPSQGKSVKDVEAAIRGQIRALQERPVPAAELERVKTQVVTAKIYQQDSMFYQGMQLGVLASIGLDWRLRDQYVDRIKAVTAAQVQAMARKYLVDDRLTVAELKPLPLTGAPVQRSHGGSKLVH